MPNATHSPMVAEIIAQARAQVVTTRGSRQITRGQLEEIFELVSRPNWKEPIDAEVAAYELDALSADLDLLAEAIAFFTGSEARIEPTKIANRYRVRAAGYYLTVGA